MKLFELLNATVILNRLDKMKTGNVKLSYAIARNLIRMQPEIDAFEKSRIKLLEEHATKSEDGTQWVFNFIDGETDEEERKKQQLVEVKLFDKEINDITNSDIDFQPFKVKLETFEHVDPTPEELRLLMWMIED